MRSRGVGSWAKGRLLRATHLSLVQGGRGLHVGRGVELELHGPIEFGSNVFLSSGASLSVGPSGELVIGDGVFIGKGTVVAASVRIEIGANTLIGEHCSIRDGDHQASASERLSETELRVGVVTIGEAVWIGAGSRILRGSTIGDGAVVGANAVVKTTVQPHSTVVGAPARPIR